MCADHSKLSSFAFAFFTFFFGKSTEMAAYKEQVGKATCCKRLFAPGG